VKNKQAFRSSNKSDIRNENVDSLNIPASSADEGIAKRQLKEHRGPTKLGRPAGVKSVSKEIDEHRHCILRELLNKPGYKQALNQLYGQSDSLVSHLLKRRVITSKTVEKIETLLHFAPGTIDSWPKNTQFPDEMTVNLEAIANRNRVEDCAIKEGFATEFTVETSAPEARFEQTAQPFQAENPVMKEMLRKMLGLLLSQAIEQEHFSVAATHKLLKKISDALTPA
jgi:hypothetical protein